MYPEKLHIEPTKRTPWLVLEQGRIFIMGRSIIENPGSFYEQVHNWVNGYAAQCKGKTSVEIGFEYINTGSLKWLYILLRELAGMDDLAGKASVKWFYEEGDDDMYELGHIIKSLMECPFSIMQVESMNDEFYKSLLSGAQ
jgi:hypothetical protein